MGPGKSITKIKAIKTENLSQIFNYITNQDKTTLLVEIEDVDAVGDSIEGIAKTTSSILVSGHNCSPNTAKTEFMLAKETYLDSKKEALRPGEKASTAYHVIQSFEGTDYDPKFIHKLGEELCKEMLGDRFQAVIATHMNTENIHNHIVFNAYSINGEFKYHDKKSTVALMKELNDKISKKYGLEIIIDPDNGKTHSYKEYMEIKNNSSWKEQIRRDILDAASESTNFEEYKKTMQDKGYILKENENSITYQMEGSENKVRDVKLGKEYTKEELIKAWEKAKEIEKLRKNVEEIENVRHKKESLYVSKYTINGRKRTLLEMAFLKAIKILKRISSMIKDAGQKAQYESKIQSLMEAMEKSSSLNISSREELLDRINTTGALTRSIESDNKQLTTYIGSLEEHKGELRELEELKSMVVAMGLFPKDLVVASYDESEIRKNRASLYPMSNNQKKVLFSILEEHKEFKINIPFDEISKKDAKEIIDYANGKSEKKPECVVSPEEFELKRLVKRYEAAKKNRLERLKEKNSIPLTEPEKATLLKLVGEKEIDILNATKYDLIRVLNSKKTNPLLVPAKDDTPVSNPKLLESLRDLLKIYPEEDIDNISTKLETLDNDRANKLYNYLMEKDLVPEILVEDKEEIFERITSELSNEEIGIVYRYRELAEKLESLGIVNERALNEEIDSLKEELKVQEEYHKEISKEYWDLKFIERQETSSRDENFIYGDIDKNSIEIKETEEAKEEEEDKEIESRKKDKPKSIKI